MGRLYEFPTKTYGMVLTGVLAEIHNEGALNSQLRKSTSMPGLLGIPFGSDAQSGSVLLCASGDFGTYTVWHTRTARAEHRRPAVRCP